MGTAAPHVVETSTLRYLIRAGGAVSGYAPPLLCFLHGYDEGAPLDILAALTRYGPLRANTPSTAIAPFVIVAPQ